jgi:hypothetical protein
MTNIFNKKHHKEYGVYGGIAGLFHALAVWYFLRESNYLTAPILFIGSILFMMKILPISLGILRIERRLGNYPRWKTFLNEK